MVIRQRALRLFILNKSDHSPITKRIKFVIVVGLDILDGLGSLLEEFVANVLFERISIICYESLPIIKLNLESLVVEWHPSTTRGSLARSLVVTLLSLNSEILLQVHFPDGFRGKTKCRSLGQDLELVR